MKKKSKKLTVGKQARKLNPYPGFPNLTQSDFKITSPATAIYNCIAWAASTDHTWWWPTPPAYWPKGVERVETIDAFVQAFQTLGFIVCKNSNLEVGFEKVCLYADNSETPTHMARQQPNGTWTSKLGLSNDIQHNSTECLEGKEYGRVVKYLKRPKK